MPYLALTSFALLATIIALGLLALAHWWSPPTVRRDRPRPSVRLPLHPYRALFFVLVGEVVLILFSAWAVHFRAGLEAGRTHLAEMGIFALVVLVGLFYLWRKER